MVREQDVLETFEERGLQADFGPMCAHDEGAEDEVAMQIAGAGKPSLGHTRFETGIFLDLTEVV